MAVVVDDHAMDISHVLRAEEWLPSTPRHVQLYRALDLPMPQFGHLPMILGSDRAKLSKRHGATSLMEYRDDGFVPEALINFMALLGWSLDGETDVMTVDTIRDHFTLERVGKPAAIFDLDKLQWMNGVYIRQADGRERPGRPRVAVPGTCVSRPPVAHRPGVPAAHCAAGSGATQRRWPTLPICCRTSLRTPWSTTPKAWCSEAWTFPARWPHCNDAHEIDLSAVAAADFHHENLEALLRATGRELECRGGSFSARCAPPSPAAPLLRRCSR